MALKYTEGRDNTSLLNKELRKLDQARRDLLLEQRRTRRLRESLTIAEEIRAESQIDNSDFQWDGPNTKITWVAFKIKNKAGDVIQVPAGERTALAASTYYWLAWNPVHKVMAAATAVDTLTNNPLNLIVCRVFTGTGVQAGDIGGGGSTAAVTSGGLDGSTGGTGLTGREYKIL